MPSAPYGESGNPEVDQVAITYTLSPNQAPSAPDTLRTESNTNPINLNDITPEFSAVFKDTETGASAIKYQVQVNSASTFTGTMLWDTGSGGTALSGTGCAVNTRCEEISYAGSDLTGGTTYYWRIKFWDDENTEGAWSTEQATFSLETQEPSSQILYPQDGDDLSRLPRIIGTASDLQTSIDFVKMSLKDETTSKWFSGTGFVLDTEEWLLTTGKENWSYFAPTWIDGHRYTIRTRATDVLGNEEHTAEATFSFNTSNGEEGSIYAESIKLGEETNYTVYFPVSIALNSGDYVEVIFDSGAYVFTGSMADSDVNTTSASGAVTASTEVINTGSTMITSTITGSVTTDDVLQIAFTNNKIKNPTTAGIYTVTIKTYNSGSTLLESGLADVTISGMDIALNVEVPEALVLNVDTGSLTMSIDPDIQLGQNWVGTGATTYKSTLTVSTNNAGGYHLDIALAGQTATGSAVLDGTTNTGNQLLTGDAKSVENRFGWALTSTAAVVNSFGTQSSPTATGVNYANRIENDSNSIYYFLNVDHEQQSDTYKGSIIYTATGNL